MNDSIKNSKEKMEKTLDATAKEFAAIRSGRANPAILDKITFEYYGAPTQINAAAAVQVENATTIAIQPWDVTALKAIEKAINASDIGISPQNDGKTIRLAFPPPSEERRKELVKQVHKYGEEAKVAVRNVRRDADAKFKAQKKTSEITEDDLKDLEKEIQKLTDEYIGKIDKLIADKEKELLEKRA